MRKSVVQNGIIVKAYAGTTGVLLAFNLKNDADRAGLLGFAVQRDGGEFLPAMIPFPGQIHNPGDPIGTDKAPVQKFRWSDYTVDAGTTYKYSVYAVRGTPSALVLGDSADVTITTEPRSASTVIGSPDNIVTVSNRAVAASQAFSREFPATNQKLNTALAKGKTTKDILTAPEMKWLSNGLLEEVVAFIQLAKDKTFALDVAIYQYELADIVDAIDAANKAGATVRLIYHAQPGDSQTTKNIKSASGLPKDAVFGRVTNAIFHHKFIVLSSLDGGTKTPIAVLCGSTNFTSNAVYSQANNVQITSNAVVLKHYVDQFNFLFDQPAHTPSVTAVQDTEQNILDASVPLQVGFSPRNGKVDLNFFATLINAAKQDLLFATAFGLDKVIMAALNGQPHDSILRYGIQDKATEGMTGVHADQTASFTAASTIPKGLDGWLDERRTPGALGNILIHDKIVVIDFTSDNPVVINGSHNYSANASAHNDENYLIIRGNTSVADCLGVEVLRLYDHYRFRFVASTAKKAPAKAASAVPQQPMTLHPDDSWTNDYYDATTLKYADRMVFSGMLHGGSSAAPLPGGTAVPVASVQQVRQMAGAAGTASAAVTSAKVAKEKTKVMKTLSKKAVAKKAAKKTVKKAAKKAAKKASAKKAVKKATTKKAAKKSVKKVAKKAVKKTTVKKSPAKKAAAKKTSAKKSTKKK